MPVPRLFVKRGYMSEVIERDSRQLQEICLGYGIELSDCEAKLLLRHVELVLEKNKTVNLTRIVDIHDAMIRHILDSLLFLRGMDDNFNISGCDLLDIGTGAGYPGIPLAIVSDANVTMIDSVGKKIRAVEEFTKSLGLDTRTRCFHVRAEEIAITEPGAYDYVTARAVASLGTLIEYATPLLRKNGLFVASKGNLSEEELSVAKRAAHICGTEIVSRETIELPEGMGHREIIKVRRSREAMIKLPRPIGMAKNKPLS